uniref:Chitin-binding type-2 domain-containing protein n=1 Tax=Cacopsylla melanoneura TaxID=428564 RepID=A0A8D8WBC4_9HEMI
MYSRHTIVELCIGLLSIICLALSATLPASPRLSFKVHNDPRIPKTSFSCAGRAPGYYADVDTGCQVYHMCDDGSRHYTYSCPNTTLFHQRMLICAHWYQVNCTHSENNFDANLLIGQRDKPFVGEDFWKHRFGGAGNTNFPPQEIPIRTLQSNAIHESFGNIEKSANEIPNSLVKQSSSKFNKVSPTPQFVQTPTPQFVEQSPSPQLVQQTPQFQQPSPLQFELSPPSQDAFVSVQQTSELPRAPLPTEQLPIAVLPPQQTFGEKFIRKPAFELEAPDFADAGNTAFTRTTVGQLATDLEAPYEDPVPVQSSAQHNAHLHKPSIELEPPISQDDSLNTVETNNIAVLAQNKRTNNRQPQRSNAGDKEAAESQPGAAAVKSNSTFDDRFTQVYIRPSGKAPVRGPYEHPELTQNKVIFTDWNSLLQQTTDENFPFSNFNEYVNGKIPGEEEVENTNDDLQRDFSNFPRPFSFVSTTERLAASPTEQTETRVPFNQLQSNFRPAVELLPPFADNDAVSNNQLSPFPSGPSSVDRDFTQVIFNNEPSFESNNAQPLGSNAQLPTDVQGFGQDERYNLDDNNTVVIQNPFQHPFYKVRKMSDNQNLIFIPLTDSDFALELRKVPLNRTRGVRRVVVRKRHTRDVKQSVKTSRNSRDTNSQSKENKEDHQTYAKCGHCVQGYLVDREGCVPCVPIPLR